MTPEQRELLAAWEDDDLEALKRWHSGREAPNGLPILTARATRLLLDAWKEQDRAIVPPPMKKNQATRRYIGGVGV